MIYENAVSGYNIWNALCYTSSLRYFMVKLSIFPMQIFEEVLNVRQSKGVAGSGDRPSIFKIFLVILYINILYY